MNDVGMSNEPTYRMPGLGRVNRWLAATAIGGLGIAILVALFTNGGWYRFQLAYLVAFAFVLSLSLGGLFFVLVQHLARAGWSVLIRRPAEILAANMIVVAILFVPLVGFLVVSSEKMYPWAEHVAAGQSAADEEHDSSVGPDAEKGHHGPVLSPHKRVYLSVPSFVARWVVLLAVWCGLGLFYWRTSVRQDSTGAARLTLRMENFAGPAALALALTLTIGAIDLLMSLEPNWYSTIFGVYFFAGSAVGAIALLLASVLVMRQHHLVSSRVGGEHLRDLGRLLFAFLFFWAYIAFSQYMLLWYANVPETTSWLVRRGASTATGYTNSWSIVLLLLLFGHFLVPFAGFMSRHVKSSPRWMMGWCGWLLLMHYADLFWIVMPVTGPRFSVSLIDVGVLIAVCSVYLLGGLRLAAMGSLVAIGDPRYQESAALADAY